MRRRFGIALLALLGALLLTGCGAIDVMLDTEEALSAAGFRDPSVSLDSTNGYETVTVEWDADAVTTEMLADESLRAAGVVWQVARIDLDAIALSPYAPMVGDSVETVRTFERAELEARLGPRSPGLDRDAGEVFNVGEVLAWVAVIAVLGIGAIAAVVVVLVRASRRKRAAQAAWYGMPPPGGWPPPGQWPAPPGQWRAPPPGQWAPPPGPPPGQWGAPPAPPPGQWGAPPAPGAPPGAPPPQHGSQPGSPPGSPPGAPPGPPPGQAAPPPADPWRGPPG